MDAERARIAGDAPWKKIQQNTFTRWTNEHLKIANSSMENLETDFSDGLRLILLVEVLSQKRIARYNKNPTFRTQKLENVSIALEFLQEEGIKIVNIDSSHIVDGKLKLIMGLVWTLIVHYSISMPMWDGDEEQNLNESGLTPKQRLLNWIQLKLPDMPIKNFTHDWTTGKPVGALVDACAPGLCPDWELWDPNDAVQNATEAMTLADDWLDIRQLIRPEELVDPNVDEQSVMTYLSQYPSAKLKDGAPLRPKSDPNSLPVPIPVTADGVRAFGPGLEPVGILIGTTVKFTVDTFAAGEGIIEVDVEDSNGEIEQAYVDANNDANLTYTISYMPKMVGTHKVTVRFSGIEIPDSPFYVQVDHPVEDCPNFMGCYDDYVDLPIVDQSTQIDEITEGMSFTFCGEIGQKCDSFSFNFLYMNEAKDIALHINPRLKSRYIVRNTLYNKVWGPEEVNTPTPFSLSRGSRFKVQVLVTSDCYLISINNRAFTQYKHRLPFESVRILSVKGDVQLHQIYRTIVQGYPSRFPNFGPPTGELEQLSLIENCLQLDSFFEGHSFIFCGSIANNCDKFSINFVEDNEHRDISLHIVTRLKEETIVRNSKKNNNWGKEEASSKLPFLLRPGGTFTIQVLVTTTCYLISVDGHHFAQFQHRSSYGAVRFLEVWGEVENVQIYRSVVYGYPVPIMPGSGARCIE